MTIGKTSLALTCCALLLAFCACKDEPENNMRVEDYYRYFVKNIGVCDMQHEWKNIDQATIDIDLGSQQAALVGAYIANGDAYSLVGLLANVSGHQTLSVYVPTGTSEVIIDVDGQQYAGTIGQSISCTGAPATARTLSDAAYMWTWASEDAGMMCDLDFNDVVFGIRHLTTNIAAVSGTAANPVYDTSRGMLSVYQFTPMAAGIIYPAYINFKFKRSGGDVHNVVLAPGVFDLTGSEALVPAAREFHHWFGDYVHTRRINTDIGTKVPVRESDMSCWVIMPQGTSINLGTTLPYEDNPDFDITHGYASVISGAAPNSALFYVTVNDAPECENLADGTESLRNDNSTPYIIPLPSRGSSPFSLLVGNNGKSLWRWPKEYVNILDPYPAFQDWVKDRNVSTDWADGVKTVHVVDAIALTTCRYIDMLAGCHAQ